MFDSTVGIMELMDAFKLKTGRNYDLNPASMWRMPTPEADGGSAGGRRFGTASDQQALFDRLNRFGGEFGRTAAHIIPRGALSLGRRLAGVVPGTSPREHDGGRSSSPSIPIRYYMGDPGPIE
jgi:hypothetical protein